MLGQRGAALKGLAKILTHFAGRAMLKIPEAGSVIMLTCLHPVSVFREVTPDLKCSKSHFKSAGVKSGDDFESPDYQEDSVMVSIMLAFTCGCHGA